MRKELKFSVLLPYFDEFIDYTNFANLRIEYLAWFDLKVTP